MADPDLDQNVQVFKIKRLIRNLEKARGNGTSMISLIIPPKEQVAKQQKVPKTFLLTFIKILFHSEKIAYICRIFPIEYLLTIIFVRERSKVVS